MALVDHHGENYCSQRCAQNNDQQDKAPGMRISMRGDGLLDLPSYYVAKQRVSTNVLVRVHAMFMHVRKGGGSIVA